MNSSDHLAARHIGGYTPSLIEERWTGPLHGRLIRTLHLAEKGIPRFRIRHLALATDGNVALVSVPARRGAGPTVGQSHGAHSIPGFSRREISPAHWRGLPPYRGFAAAHFQTGSAGRPLADTVEKVSFGWRTKFFRTAGAPAPRRREGPRRFTRKRPKTLLSVLWSRAAAELLGSPRSREIRSRSIFDFFNSIGT